MTYANNPIRTGGLSLMALGFTLLLGLTGCGSDDRTGGGSAREAASAAADDRGVGPVKKVQLGPLDPELAARGEAIFSGTCAACHKLDQRYVGPAMAGITERRTPEWIMNMIVNPVEMTQKDPVAKALLAEYMTQMSVSATEEDARAILEYFRKLDGEAGE